MKTVPFRVSFLNLQNHADAPQYSTLLDSPVKYDPDICKHCLRSFQATDPTVKLDHSLCSKKPKIENFDKSKNPIEVEKNKKPTEFKTDSQQVQDSQKIIQNIFTKDKENLSSPSTSTNSAMSTTKTQDPTKANGRFQNHVNLITCEERRKKLNELLARAIYATSSPMDMTENYHWKQFFKAIRPTYIPPTAFDLRGYLLKNEYKRVMKSVENKISYASNYVLVTYGWSSPKGEIHFIVTTPEPVYFKSLVSKNLKDEVYISEHIAEVIEKIGSEKFMLLLTDDSPSMTKACDTIVDAYPHITVCKSGAEDVKLLLKDIIKLNTVQEILKKSKEMILSINLTETDVGQNEEQVKSVVRWGAISTLKTLLENKSVFQTDIVVDEIIPEEVRQKILDEDKEFWTEAERLLELLDSISEGIKTLEGDKALLSDLPNAFAEIQSKLLTFCKQCTLLQDKEKDSICSYISVRKESAVKSIHRAANMLDPRYRGGCLSNPDRMDAIEYLKQRCDHLGINEISVCTNLEDYKTSSGAYSRSFLWGTAKHISPVEWWRNFCRNQPLFRLATQLLSVSPSPTVYQRMFKGIEMNPRHGLDPEGLEQLITIKSNLLISKDTSPEVLDSILSS